MRPIELPSTHAETISAMAECYDEIERLGEPKTTPTAAQAARFIELRDTFEQLDTHRKSLERSIDLAKIRAATRGEDGFKTISADPAKEATMSSKTLPGLRGQAQRTVETEHRSGRLSDKAAEKVERLLTTGRPDEQDLTARWAVATGSPEYLRAFSKLLSDPTRGHLLWDEDEQRAYRAVTEVRAAMSLTDANGGYMVPMTLDPAINLTGDGTTNSIRDVARVVQTATESWTGINSAGATAEWKAEGAQAADGSPAVDDVPIPVHFGDVFVPYSFEVGMDAMNFTQELSIVLQDAAANLMATAYTTGTGTGQPKGFITAAVAASSTVAPTTAETFAAADVYKVQNALQPRFQAGASWQGNLAMANTMRQFETTGGALKFPELADGQLLRRPFNENSHMDGVINPAATETNYSLAYGDFSKFVIVDRIGTQLELVPNLFGANGRPTGQRGAFLWFRTGSDLVVPNAVKVLSIPTTA